MKQLEFKNDDGGRSHYLEELGLNATNVGDCVTRAISIATKTPYNEVYREMLKRHGSASNGVADRNYGPYLVEKNWRSSGRPNSFNAIRKTGRRRSTDGYIAEKRSYFCGGLHVNARDLPMKGPVLVRVYGHLFAMIDGTVHDTGFEEWRLSPERKKYGTCVGGLCVTNVWRPKKYKPIKIPTN